MQTCFKTIRVLVIITACMAIFASSANAEERGIAVLDSFEGRVVIKNLGKWGKPPATGMTLFAGDKIVTVSGSATVRYHDGSTLDIQPNSNARIVDKYRKQLGEEVEHRAREIQLYIGKMKYKSGPNAPADTKLFSKTAVAALRGTELWFGAVDEFTFINQTEGTSEKQGNITEGYVPEVTFGQAENEPCQQTSLEAARRWEEYETVKFGIPRASNEPLWLAMNSDALLPIIIAAFDAGKGDDPVEYAEVMLLKIKALKAGVLANKEDAKALLKNPDPRAVTWAKKAIASADKSLQPIDRVEKKIEKLSQKIKDILKKKERMSGLSPELRKKAIGAIMAEISALVNSHELSTAIAESETTVSELIYLGAESDIEQTVKNAKDEAADSETKANAASGAATSMVDKMLQAIDQGNMEMAEAYATAASIASASAAAHSSVGESSYQLGMVAWTTQDPNQVNDAKSDFDETGNNAADNDNLAAIAEDIVQKLAGSNDPAVLQAGLQTLAAIDTVAQAKSNLAEATAVKLGGDATGVDTVNLQGKINEMNAEIGSAYAAVINATDAIMNNNPGAALKEIENNAGTVSNVSEINEGLDSAIISARNDIDKGVSPVPVPVPEPLPGDTGDTGVETDAAPTPTPTPVPVIHRTDLDGDGYFGEPAGQDPDDSTVEVTPQTSATPRPYGQ